MSTVKYTALRKMEPTGYAKSGTDISAAAADDSLNASVTVLTGLLADQWALVSGFANAGNNGWFQVKSDSVSGKILQVTPPVTHLRLPAVAGNYASTPDSAANSVTGDFELRARAQLNDWTPAAAQTLLAKWNTTGNQRSYALSVNTDGTLNLSWSNDGTAVISKSSTVATGFADLATRYVRATLDVDNGAAGNDVKFYTSTDGVAWAQLGATVTTAGVTSVFNSTAVLEVGSISAGTAQLAAGRIYYASLLNGLAGTTVAAFDAALGSRSSLTFQSSTGETWTVSQSGTPPAQLQGRALVTEAAGPNVSIVGYVRGLNQTYTIEFDALQLDRESKVKRSVQQPIGGGAPEVLHYRSEEYDQVGTSVIEEAKIKQWREFLASVEGGEQFTFDKYGTVAAPVGPLPAMMASEGHKEAREGPAMRYRIDFNVRLLG